MKQQIEWKEGCPPKNDNKTYLLKFKGSIICTGRYRYGLKGEPSQNTIAWRCDCCGRYATPIEYTTI